MFHDADCRLALHVVSPGVRTKEISRALVCNSLAGGHFVLVSTLHKEC